MRSPVRLSTLCLLIVGMADLISSLIWLHAGYGEGNPLFAWLASHGALAFALGKVAFLAGPVAILEFARRHRPHSAEIGTWAAVVLYVLFLAEHARQMFG